MLMLVLIWVLQNRILTGNKHSTRGVCSCHDRVFLICMVLTLPLRQEKSLKFNSGAACRGLHLYKLLIYFIKQHIFF